MAKVTTGFAGAGGPASRRPGARAASAALALVAAALAGCDPHVEGNGVFLEEDRTGDLGQLEVRGVAVWDGVAAIVTVGSPRSVKVSGDANVLSKLRTSVVTDEETGLAYLNVSVSTSYTSVHPLRVVATLPDVSLLRARGIENTPEETPSSVDARAVATAALHVLAGEGSEVKVAGAGAGGSPALGVELSGGASLDARLYAVSRAEVELSGDSLAQVRASERVDGVAVPPSRVTNVLAEAAVCAVEDGQGNEVSCAP